MAITALEFMVLCSFREHGILPPHPRVLELGQSNWYGDVTIDELQLEIQRLVTDPTERDQHLGRLRAAVVFNGPNVLYDLARIFFSAIVRGDYSAIDPGTTGSKFQFDLNLPVLMDLQFDLTMNIGTAEHIFNVYQFFKTAHERTVTGGLMMHSSPFNGWPDHGFFNFQPTFYFDLARSNQYEILSFVFGSLKPFKYVQVREHDDIPHLIKAGKIAEGSHINVLFRKKVDDEFVVPMQGYYAGTLSKALQQQWHDLR